MSVCVRTCVYVCVCARVLVPAGVGSHAMLIWVMHMFPRVHCVHANVCVHVCVYARACVRMHARACAKLGVEGGGGLTVLVLFGSILWCPQGQCGSGFTVQEVHVNAHL